MKNIPDVLNVDSLEVYMTKHPKSDIKEYLRDLIILEKNNIDNRREMFGKHLPTIYSLSRFLGETGALAAYYFYNSEYQYTNVNRRIDIVSAYEQLEYSIQLYEQLGDTLGLANCYKRFVWHYCTNKKLIIREKINQYIRNGEGILANTKNITVKLLLLEMKAKRYYEDKNINKYENIVDSISLYLKKYPNVGFNKESFYLNAGAYYLGLGKTHKALDLTLKSCPKNKTKFNLALYHINLSELYILLADLPTAKLHLDSSWKVIKRIPQYIYLFEGHYQNCVQYCIANKQYQLAFSFQDSVNYYRSKLEKQIKNDDIESHLYKLNEELKNREITFLNTENKLFKTILYILTILLIIFVILLSIIINMRTKLKTVNSFLLELITVTSHDLRSPILAINGLQNLIHQNLKKENYHIIYRISEEVEKNSFEVMSLLNNLLAWIHSFYIKSNITITKINLNDFLIKHIELYNIQSQLYHSSIKLIIERELTINTDENVLSVLLRNGLDNALKNSQKHPILLIARKSNNDIIFEIKNKQKLNAIKIERIMKNFNQKSNISSNEQGFGFRIMAFFSKKINARIEIKSDQNGTVLSFHIPK